MDRRKPSRLLPAPPAPSGKRPACHLRWPARTTGIHKSGPTLKISFSVLLLHIKKSSVTSNTAHLQVKTVKLSLYSLGTKAGTQSGPGRLTLTKTAFPSFWVTELWLKRTGLSKAACVPAARCHPGEVGPIQINFPQRGDTQRHEAPLFKILGNW